MAEKEEDIISRLPDDILSHILSFLELKEAVKTSILSKRWEKVWTLIHRISLDYSWLTSDGGNYAPFEEHVKRRPSFNNFLSRILCSNNRLLSVTSFRLLYYVLENKEFRYVSNWVAAAITPRLENFDFSLEHNLANQATFKIPRARILLECQKLVTLKLYFDEDNKIFLDVPETVSLPSLEILHLTNVKFNDESTLKNLLLGCPVLEELYLKKIYAGHGVAKQNIFVSSPSLKILRVNYVDDPHSSGVFDPFCSNYVVDAPKLEDLDFVDVSLWGFTMTASPCLVSAVLIIWAEVDFSVTSIFQGISNAQNLELGTGYTMMHKDELANLPEFHNLIHFKIRWCENRDIIPCILQHSPHLEHLVVESDHLITYTFIWNPPEWVPECLTSHLQIIEIGIFGVSSSSSSCEEETLKLIQYFLDNGKVLKKMALTSYDKPSDEFLDNLKELSRADDRLCFFFEE